MASSREAELTARLSEAVEPTENPTSDPKARKSSFAARPSFRANSVTQRTSVSGTATRPRNSTVNSDNFNWADSNIGTDVRKCALDGEDVADEERAPVFRDVLTDKLDKRIASQRQAKWNAERLEGVLPLQVLLICSGLMAFIRGGSAVCTGVIPIFYVVLQLIRFIGYMWTEVVPDNFVTHYRGAMDLVFTIYVYTSFPAVLRVLTKMRAGSLFTKKADKGIGTLVQVLCWLLFFPLQIIPPIYNFIYFQDYWYIMGLESAHLIISIIRSCFLSSILVTIFLVMRLLRLELKSVRAGITEGKEEMSDSHRESLTYFGNLLEVYCRVQQRVTMVSNSLQSTLAFLLFFAVNSYIELLMRFSLNTSGTVRVNSPAGVITCCRNASYILLAAVIHGYAAHLTALSDKTLNVLTHQYGCMMNGVVQTPDNELTNSGVLIVQSLDTLAGKGGFKILSYRIDFQSFGLVITLVLTLFQTLSSNIKF